MAGRQKYRKRKEKVKEGKLYFGSKNLCLILLPSIHISLSKVNLTAMPTFKDHRSVIL